MDYKAVLEEQIRELQKLADENSRDKDTALGSRIFNAVAISEQVRKLVADVKGPI